ncbi:K(+)-transporting ATPase subunit F [Lactococcus lactis]
MILGIIIMLLAIYLFYALIYPERF